MFDGFCRASLMIAVGALALATGDGAGAGAGTGRRGQVDQHRLENAAAEPMNWATYGGSYEEQRFSPLRSIHAGNVGRLGLVWSFEFDTSRGQEATPLVVDGVMYTSSAWSKVFALDARTGKLLWKFDPQIKGERGVAACCDVVNRGVAIWKGKVFVGTIDGRLIALDAASGRKLWDVQTTDPAKPYTITGAPRVFNDKVVIGNGGADLGVRGYVTAYDSETGRKLWRFYTVPGDPAAGPDGEVSDPVMARAAATWSGDWFRYGGGGSVWDSIVYDPALNQLYLGIGNGSPWPRSIRSAGKGDNLFLGSVVALDADSGAYRWHYQETPGDSWDYTSTQQITLAELTIEGRARRVILHAPKNGFFYVIDRETGKLISARNFVPVTWATHIDPASGRPVYAANAFYEKKPFLAVPASTGAHSWHPMSFSPLTGLVYIPAMQRSTLFAKDEDFRFAPGRWNTGATHPTIAGLQRPSNWGALIAWDPIRQREAWRVPQPDVWNGGTLATAGNLVFAGNAHGEFWAYRATDGAPLWHFTAQSSILAGPVTYSVKGEQYIAVLAGAGGFYPLFFKVQGQDQQAPPPGRVLVFKIGGRGTIPHYDLRLPPANPTDESFTPEQITAGGKLYAEGCGGCHSGHVLPDLRRSGALTDRSSWRAIVVEKALKEGGMAPFWVTADQAEALRAFVNEQAKILRDEGAARAAKP